MDWQDTLYRWQEFAEKLYPVRDEVAYIFETKCFYDDNWEYQERLYEADDDTVFLLKLAEMLNETCDFVNSHIGVLEHHVDIEYEIRANLEQSFEAWKRGLCPKLMKSVPRYVRANSSNWWETYDEVAAFLSDGSISYSSTLKAIRDWEASCENMKLTA